jgi:cytochrome c-type biogenesis protein CcmH/NrfF
MEPLAVRATRRFLVVAILALSLGALAGGSPTALAADEPNWAYELWHDLMSPYCPGRTLAECPSPAADELRLWILTQAAAGADRSEVEASLYARFGDEIRTTPRAEGWGLAAYVIPSLAFLAFGGVVLLVLRRLVGAGDKSPAAASTVLAQPPALSAAMVSGGRYSEADLERMVDEEFNA